MPDHVDRTRLLPRAVPSTTRPRHARPMDTAPIGSGAHRSRSRRRARHPFLAALLWFVTFVTMGLMALRYAPSVLSNGHLIPEVASFIPYLALVSLIILIPAIVWHRRVLVAVTVACLVAQVAWHSGYFLPARTKAPAATQPVVQATTDDTVLRVMTLNTAVGGANAAEIVQAVRDEHVEVLALQEVTPQLLANLSAAGLEQVLPHRVLGVRTAQDNGGINGLWTLAPLANSSQSLIPSSASAVPAASITVGSRTIRLLSVHPSSPHTGQRGFWNAGLASIRELAQYEHDYVILGDFNSTWDHSRFRKLLGTAFVDASEQAGEGFHMTYPSDPSYARKRFGVSLPPVLEIDHIVYAKDSGISAGGLKTVKITGTDHLALVATLAVQ